MIARLRGQIVAQEKDFLIIDTGGVGYKVFVTTSALAGASLESTISLFTHLVVRETAHELFGFSTLEELRLFEMLIGVSGIGPRSALAILGLADVATLRTAVAKGDTSYLTKVSGIGKKNAEKIVLELRDKLGALGDAGAIPEGETDTLEALRTMGYTLSEAREALKAVPKDITAPNERLKEALRHLAK